MPTALVTGATGLIGMHLIPRLQREGWQVRALVRDPARAGLLSRADVSLATGDDDAQKYVASDDGAGPHRLIARSGACNPANTGSYEKFSLAAP